MSKDIKVIFRGTKAPSGKDINIEYLIGQPRLDILKASNMFDMEIDMPKESPKKKKAKKESSDE